MAAEFSTLVIPLYLDELTSTRLDKAFFAQFQIRRALTRYGNTQLTLMRQSLAWKTARQLPTGKDSDGKVVDDKLHKARNNALGATQKSFGLTESTFKSLAMAMRKHSKWMPNLIDSQAAGNVGREVWTSFAGHLFGGKGRPKHVSQYNSPNVISGNVRDLGRGEANEEEIATATSKGKKPPQPRKPGWRGIHLVGTYQAGPHIDNEPQGPWTTYTGTLTVIVPINRTREAYALPLYRLWPTTDRPLSHQASSPLSHQQERYQYYLSDPSLWYQVKLVRRRVKGRVRYECHLLVKKPPYRPAARYKHIDLTSSVGIDVGVSTIAAVAVRDGSVKTAVLIKPSEAEKAKDKKRAKYLRRQQRALERKRRAANPQAYDGKSKKTDPSTGKPMRTPNTSKAYRALRDRMADQSRKLTETKQHQANHIAIKLVQDLGANVYTESVKISTWQRRWGSSILRFSPSDMMTRILREARLAGGTADSLPLSLALTASCHCGSRVKKPLSQRLHRCEVCGAGQDSPVDRDLHSALLAACVMKDDTQQFYLDTDKASVAYQVGQGLLATVSSVPRDYFLGTSQSGTTTRVATEGEVVVTISSNPIDVVASGASLGVRAMGRYGLTEVNVTDVDSG